MLVVTALSSECYSVDNITVFFFSSSTSLFFKWFNVVSFFPFLIAHGTNSKLVQ